MSTLEVIDAVQRSLYNEGFLQTVRAQLRANVLRIISGGPDYMSETGPIVDLSRRESGSIALQILKEFLQHLNLKQTLTIFEAEVGYESIREDGKDSLCDSLHLGRTNDSDCSILERMVTASLASTLSVTSRTTIGNNSNTDTAAANNSNSSASKIDTSVANKRNTVSDDSKQDVTNKVVDLHTLVPADKYSIKAFDDVLEMDDEDDNDDAPPQYSSYRPTVASMKDVERRTDMKPHLDRDDDPTTESESTIHLKDDMNNAQSKYIGDKKSLPTFNLHKQEANDSDAEVDEIEEEIEEVVEEEEGPEYESDEDEVVKGPSADNDNSSNQKLSGGAYVDDYTVSSQRNSMSTRINVRRTAERNNVNTEQSNNSDSSKVNVFRLNQASTTRSQSGWGALDEARYDDFAADDDGDDLIGRKEENVVNTRMTSISTLPVRGSSSANNSSHEFEGDTVKSVSNNADVDVSLSSYTSNQEEEEEPRAPSRNSNQEDGEVRSNQTEGKGKWSSVVKYDDEDEEVEEEEEYAAEDFEDDFEEENLDKSQSSPEKSFGGGSKSSPDRSFEDEEIEEEISIGESSNQSSDSDFNLNDKVGNKNKNNDRAVSEGMFRARSGVLPHVPLDRGGNRSDNLSVKPVSSSLEARMRQIDEQLQDYENEDTEGNLKDLRKQYEKDDDDDSVASEDLNEIDFSTGGLEADERLDPNESSGEGSFSFLDSSSKGHDRK